MMDRNNKQINRIANQLWVSLILFALLAGFNLVQAAATYIGSQQYSHTSGFPAGNISITVSGLGSGSEDRTIIVTMAGDGNSPGGSASCSDNQSGSYTKDLEVRNGQTNSFLVICSRELLAGATAPTQITVNHTGAYDRVITVHEFSGLLSAPAADQSSSATGSSTPASSGTTATTSQTDELLIGAIAVPGSLADVSDDSNTDFTGSHEYNISSLMTVHMQYGVVSSTGTYSYAPPVTSGKQWSAGIVTYKAEASNTTISGTVYSDKGVTNIGSGIEVQLDINGTPTATATTNASGQYSITASPAVGDKLLLYISNNSTNGNSVTVSDGNSITGLDLHGNRLIVYNHNGGSTSNANISTAKGADADNDIFFSVSGNDLTLDNAVELFVPSTHTYAPGGNLIAEYVKILGTFDATGIHTFTITLDWDAGGGTYTQGTSTLDFVGGDNNFTPGTSSYYNVRKTAGSNTVLLALGSNLTVSNDLLINNGKLDVSASNYSVTIGGDFTIANDLVERSGMVTLNGTNQTLTGPITFYGLTKTVVSADTLTVNAGDTLTVSNAITLTGASGQLLSLRSSTPGIAWNLIVNSGVTKSLSYLDIKDGNNSGSDASHKPLNPTNSTNSGGNTDWFAANAPVGGYTADNVIPTAQITQATDGSGIITINWKGRDAETNNVSLKTFEYSVNGGSTWNAPTNADTSASLSTNWDDNGGSKWSTATTLASATAHSFTFNTQHADVSGLASVDQSDVQVRFTLNDGGSDSVSPVTSQNFQVDNVSPTATITSAEYNPATNTMVITGTNFTTIAAASTDIKSYVDWTKFVWDINGDDATTANITFVVGDVTSLTVTDATTLTLIFTSAKGTAIEATAGYGSTGGADTLDVSAGFSKDVAGNATTTDAVANAPIGSTISGTVYTDEGVTTIADGATVRLIINGESVATNTTSSGAYSFTSILYAGDAIVVYLDGHASDGTTVTINDGNDLSGLDIYADHLIVRHDNGGSLTNANMSTALGAYSDTEILYSVDGSNVLTVSGTGTELYVPTGHTYQPDAGSAGDVSTTNIKILGTLTADGNTITVSGDWDSSSGTFNYNTSTVDLTGTGNLNAVTNASYEYIHFYNLTMAAATKTTTLLKRIGIGNVLTLGTGTITGGFGKEIGLLKNSGTPLIDGGAAINVSALYYRPSNGTVTVAGGTSYTSEIWLWPSGSNAVFNIGGAITSTKLLHIDVDTGNSGVIVNTQNNALTLYKIEFGIGGSAGSSTFNAGSSTIDVDEAGVKVSAGNHTVNLGSATITNAGDWDALNGTHTLTVDPGTSTITFDGLFQSYIESNGSAFNNLVVNKTSGTDAGDNLTIQTHDLTVNGTLTITDGELIQTRSLTTGAVTLSDASSKWTNVTNNANVTLSGAVTNTGTITFDAPTGDLIQIRSSVGGTQRNWQGSGTFSMTDVDVQDQTAIGGTPANITVTSGTNSGNNINWLFGSNTVGGTVYTDDDEATTLNNKAVKVVVHNGVSQTSYTTTTNGSGVYSAIGVTLASGDIVQVYLNDEIEEGLTVLESNGADVADLNVYQNHVGIRSQVGVVSNGDLNNVDDGDDDVKYSVSGNNITLDSGYELYIFSSSNYTPGGNVTTQGTAGNVDIRGTITSEANVLTINGDWNNNSGTFTAGTSTVVLNGTSQAVNGSTTFYNLTKSVAAADTLTFEATNTTTIATGGTVTLNGASGQLLTLASSTGSSTWNFNVALGATKAIDYVSVSWSDASGSHSTQKPISPTNSTNGGNNTGWFNTPPIGGYTADDVIPAAQVTQATDGSGVITINWKGRDDQTDNITLNTFEYSDDGGLTWYAPTNGDISAALSTNWDDNGSSWSTATTLGAATAHSFTFNTKHADVTGVQPLDGVDQSDVQVRFTLNDGTEDSASPATSESFQVDNLAPTTTITSASYTASSNTMTITGTNFTTIAAASTDIKSYVDWSKFVWDINGDNATTADISFVVGDVTSLTVTDATTLTLVFTSAKGTAIEATAGYGGGDDTLDVTAGFSIDAFGNVATGDNVADATLTVGTPTITIMKLSSVISDPVNGGTNPKRIPGAVIEYSIVPSNSGTASPDANSTIITDVIDSTNVSFDATTGVSFTDGTTTSGLTMGAVTYSSTAAPGPYIYDYTPVPDGDGYDGNITSIKATTTGTFAYGGTPTASFTLKYKVRVE